MCSRPSQIHKREVCLAGRLGVATAKRALRLVMPMERSKRTHATDSVLPKGKGSIFGVLVGCPIILGAQNRKECLIMGLGGRAGCILCHCATSFQV